jgi:hypothetical protein
MDCLTFLVQVRPSDQLTPPRINASRAVLTCLQLVAKAPRSCYVNSGPDSAGLSSRGAARVSLAVPSAVVRSDDLEWMNSRARTSNFVSLFRLGLVSLLPLLLFAHQL